MKLTIPGVVPVSLPIADEHVRPYKGPNDPPLEWYKTFCSAQYYINRVKAVSPVTYLLTPVIGRPVYTFDYQMEFIASARGFTADLFTKQLVEDVPRYRVTRSPVQTHRIYRLPPNWTWRDQPPELA